MKLNGTQGSNENLPIYFENPSNLARFCSQRQVQARIHAAVVSLYSSQLNVINYELLFTT